MNKKIYNILGTLCSSCFAWLAFFEINSLSCLLFGELEKPTETNE